LKPCGPCMKFEGKARKRILPYVHTLARRLIRRYRQKQVLRASKGKHGLVIGAFSAASNLTGVLVDTDRISMAIHRYGGLAFFDYASAGPYVPVDMNPKGVGEGAHKDGIFLSPHKFVGGVGTPGVLAVKKSLVQVALNSPPP